MKFFLALLLIAFSATIQAKPCGGADQRPCKVFERVPSCDHGLVEDFSKGKCKGKAYIEGTKNANDQLGRLRPADCGRLGQRACNVWEFVPSCEKGLLESHGGCHSADQKLNAKERNYTCGDGLKQRPCNCGAYKQRPCNTWEAVPSCERHLIERNNLCEDPNQRPDNCGHEGQRACMVHEWVPSCEGTLVETHGRCQKSYGTPPPQPRAAPAKPANRACGGLGQRPCRVHERVPSCDRGLREDFLKDICIR